MKNIRSLKSNIEQDKTDISDGVGQILSQPERTDISKGTLSPDVTVASTDKKEERRGDRGGSAELLVLAVEQIKYAFMIKKSSTEQQLNLYRSLSQVCTQFLDNSR